MTVDISESRVEIRIVSLVSSRNLLLNCSVSTRVPAVGERGSPLLLPLHPGPENGHQAARRRRLRGEGGQADEEMRTEHFGHAGSQSVRHAGTTTAAAAAAAAQSVLSSTAQRQSITVLNKS